MFSVCGWAYMLSVCGRGLEDFLFIHLKSPWTAFHGAWFAVEVVYLKEEDPPSAVGGLGRLMWAGLCVVCLWAGLRRFSVYTS